MQTLTVEIKNDNALKVLQDLQEKHFISIIAQPDLKSHVFPGEAMTTAEFKQLIEDAENSGSMSLKEAKTQWSKRKKELLKLVK
ncbi:hypothetical protein BH10BAC2_BH10BAC2_26970 [soil metagenome]